MTARAAAVVGLEAGQRLKHEQAAFEQRLRQELQELGRPGRCCYQIRCILSPSPVGSDCLLEQVRGCPPPMDSQQPEHTPRRRPGNPAMRRGAPSLNPKGRPPSWLALSNAVRARFPAAVLVEMAAHILESNELAEIKLRTLEWLATRGYGPIRKVSP